MKLIRRIYIYLVTFISFEVTAWAIIGLVRSIFNRSSIGGNATDLAQAISMILVGGIVFWIHWGMAQKDAAENQKERLSTTRAIFFYATWASLTTPVVQNFLALLVRSLSSLFNVTMNTYGFAANQSSSENVIAIFVNLILGAYIFSLVKAHWLKDPAIEAFITTRRIFRYLWKLYGLAMVIMGLSLIISYIFNSFGSIGFGASLSLVWGLSYLIVGLPLWIHIWNVIIESLKDLGERESLLRQIILYTLTLLAALISISVLGILLNEFFQAAFVPKESFKGFYSVIEETLSVGIPSILTWLYFNSILKQDRAADPSITRRSGMRRLYVYILSFFGIATTFAGLIMLVVFLADILFGGDRLIGFGWEKALINIVTFLILGLPVWLMHWLPMNAEAAEESEAGDHARRSLNRKGYLYILLFFGVIGIMFLAGSLLFLIISAILGDPPDDIAHFLAQVLGSLIFVGLLGSYHWQQLREDNLISSKSLIAKHADFSAVILDPGNGRFSELLLEEFKEQIPEMPVMVISGGGKTVAKSPDPDVVVLLASTLSQPTKSLSLWLSEFPGTRIVIPDETENWLWLGTDSGNEEKLIKKAVQAVEKLSEKQVFKTSGRSPWVYLLIGLFGLPLLCGLISFVMEFAF